VANLAQREHRGLSFASRSGRAPAINCRARLVPRSTKANRLSTSGRQSSTVTRAIQTLQRAQLDSGKSATVHEKSGSRSRARTETSFDLPRFRTFRASRETFLGLFRGLVGVPASGWRREGFEESSRDLGSSSTVPFSTSATRVWVSEET